MMYSRTPVEYRDVRIQPNHSAAFGFVASNLSLEPIAINCNSGLFYSLTQTFGHLISCLSIRTRDSSPSLQNENWKHYFKPTSTSPLSLFFPRKLWRKTTSHARLGYTSGLCAFFARCRPMALKYTKNKQQQKLFILVNFFFTCPLSLPSAWSWAAFWSL